MKLKGLMGAAGIVAIFALTSHAQAQDNGVAVAPDAAPASQPAVSAKAQRKAARHANRKLEKDVLKALSRTGKLQTATMNVIAKNGNVVLVGSLPDEAQIQQAGDVAKTVPGVLSVKNMLTIHEAGN